MYKYVEVLWNEGFSVIWNEMSNLYKAKGTYNMWSKYVSADFRQRLQRWQIDFKNYVKTMLTVKKHTT